MSLSDIQLPVSLIVDLYKKSLVEIPEHGAGQVVSSDDSDTRLIAYSGDNRKNISILVHYPHHPFLPEEELDFLSNILKACSMSVADTALINTAHYRPGLEALKKQLAPDVLLVFGSDALPVNMNTAQEFELIQTEGISTVFVPELDKLNQNNADGKVFKKKLWTILKKLFKLP